MIIKIPYIDKQGAEKVNTVRISEHVTDVSWAKVHAVGLTIHDCDVARTLKPIVELNDE